jgi:hypothetical protein
LTFSEKFSKIISDNMNMMKKEKGVLIKYCKSIFLIGNLLFFLLACAKQSPAPPIRAPIKWGWDGNLSPYKLQRQEVEKRVIDYSNLVSEVECVKIAKESAIEANNKRDTGWKFFIPGLIISLASPVGLLAGKEAGTAVTIGILGVGAFGMIVGGVNLAQASARFIDAINAYNAYFEKECK